MLLQLLDGPDQRDHDLGLGVTTALDDDGRRLEDRLGLHLEQPGDGDAEAHAAQAEHRVLLVQPVHGEQQQRVGVVLLARRLGHGDLDRQLGEVGQELVQRRVEQAHGDGQAVHRLEDLDEVGALQRQQLVEDDLPLLVALGQDEALDELAPLAEEHVLGAAQADALGPEAASAGGIRRVVGVGAHLHPAVLVGDAHQPVDGGDHGAALVHGHGALEVAHHGGGAHRDLAEEDLTGRAVDREGVALAHDGAVGRAELHGLGVDLEGLGAADAGAAHAAGHDGRVRGLAAAAGEDAGRRDHAVQVVGVGLAAHQDDGGALGGDPHGGRRSRRRPRRPRRRGRRSSPWR